MHDCADIIGSTIITSHDPYEIKKDSGMYPWCMRWSLHKYKCLLGVGDKGQSSSLQEGDFTYIYT